MSYADSTRPAYWSKFQSDAITIGDGEWLTFKFSIAETRTSGLNISAKLQSGKNADIMLESGSTTGQFVISHKTDMTAPAYRIDTGYRPTYKGKTSYPDGTPIRISDFRSSTDSDCDWYFDWGNHYDRRGWWRVNNTPTSSKLYEFDSGWLHSGTRTVTLANKTSKNSDWGVERDTSLDGKCFSVSEFQSYVWYYVPAFNIKMGGDCTSYLQHNYGEIDTDHIKASYFAPLHLATARKPPPPVRARRLQM